MPQQKEAVAHTDLVSLGLTDLHGHDQHPAMVVDSTGTQPITNIIATCNLDLPVIVDSNYGLSSSEVIINTPGIYQISYFLCYEIISASGGPRGSVHSWISSNDSGSFMSQYGSYSSSYHEEIASTFGNGTSFLLQHTNLGSRIRLRMQRLTGTTDIATIMGRTHLSIFKIR